MKKSNTSQIDTTEISLALQPIAKKAESIEITDESSLKEAVTLLSELNKYNDNIEEEKNKVLRPLLDATKAERARWKPLETMYTTAIDAIRSKMTIYQTEAIKAQQAEQQRVVKRIGIGKGKFSLNTALKKLENVLIPEKEIATEAGLVQFREKKILKITDQSMIPANFWVIDETKLLEELKKGAVVPGAELETIQVPVNYR